MPITPLIRHGATCLLALAAFTTLSAQADERGGPGRGGPRAGGPGPQFVLDARYHHDHYYPRPGWAVGGLPAGSLSVVFQDGRYFFHGGVWYRPRGPGYVVITPPIGLVIPILPPATVTVWVGAMPYYYANGVYYMPYADQGYEVVAPPANASPMPPPTVQAAPIPAPVVQATPSPDPILYPRQGQSATQTQADRQACMQWATVQNGADKDSSVFQRALAACLDGRGYTVR